MKEETEQIMMVESCLFKYFEYCKTAYFLVRSFKINFLCK